MIHFKTFKAYTGACGTRTSSINLTMDIEEVDCPECLKKFKTALPDFIKSTQPQPSKIYVLREDFNELLKIIHADNLAPRLEKRLLILAEKINMEDYGKN